MSKRTRSSSRWLAEHESDPYVRQAREEGWRSRAVFKLEEIQRSDRLIRPGMTIVDLGAAPGGWSSSHPGCWTVVAGSLRSTCCRCRNSRAWSSSKEISSPQKWSTCCTRRLDGHQADLVMSDMAPNMMGIADVDHARSMNLVDLAVEFAGRELRPGGDLLLKVFQGREFQPLLARLRREFESVKLRKPKASRGRSPEVYVLARGLRLV
jgi:23S rRNA (uridine2552-2'-O)-methyltransferase